MNWFVIKKDTCKCSMHILKSDIRNLIRCHFGLIALINHALWHTLWLQSIKFSVNNLLIVTLLFFCYSNTNGELFVLYKTEVFTRGGGGLTPYIVCGTDVPLD